MDTEEHLCEEVLAVSETLNQRKYTLHIDLFDRCIGEGRVDLQIYKIHAHCDTCTQQLFNGWKVLVP